MLADKMLICKPRAVLSMTNLGIDDFELWYCEFEYYFEVA